MARSLTHIDRPRNVLATEVYEQLAAALLDGSLGPGDRLVQDQLAKELNVSRTPVREALQRLDNEGALEPAGRRGYVVRHLSAGDIRERYDARMAIEGYAAEIVAVRGDDALKHVQAALKRSLGKSAKNARESFEGNRAIHRAIVEAADNETLLSFFDVIWNQALGVFAYHGFYAAQPYRGFAKEHRDLVAEIASGEPERARKAMVEHIASGLARTPAGPQPENGGSGRQG